LPGEGKANQSRYEQSSIQELESDTIVCIAKGKKKSNRRTGRNVEAQEGKAEASEKRRSNKRSEKLIPPKKKGKEVKGDLLAYSRVGEEEGETRENGDTRVRGKQETID